MEHKKEITVKHILTLDLFEANIVTVALTHMMEHQEDVLHDLTRNDSSDIFCPEAGMCKKIIEFCDLTIAYLNE
jgi:hypothetical protein